MSVLCAPAHAMRLFIRRRRGAAMSGAPRWASSFVGRAFSTRLEVPDEPIWEPLESVALVVRWRSAVVPKFRAGRVAIRCGGGRKNH